MLGDAPAPEALIEQHYDMIYVFCCRQVGSTALGAAMALQVQSGLAGPLLLVLAGVAPICSTEVALHTPSPCCCVQSTGAASWCEQSC